MAIESLEQAKRIAQSRVFITAPGKYQVKVTNDPSYLASTGKVTKELAGGAYQVSIVNVAAMTPYHLQKFKEKAQEGDFDGACNNSLSIGIRSKDYMPSKNEIIEVVVGIVTTKAGDEALLITSYNPLPLSIGGRVTDDMFETVDNSQEVIIEFTAKTKAVKEPAI